MSTRELERAGVFARVVAGTLSLRSAATMLAISYRQAKRLCRRYRTEGAGGLRHRSVGRPSNRARETSDRTRALALIREKYSGPATERFGPTLAAEHLASEDGVVVDHETLRRWMLAAGLWSRRRTRSPHRRRRERMAHFGELVQLDGSFHPWFERRGPQSCLLTLVDDATGQSLGRFDAQETIWAAVGVLRLWIEAHGIPRALYTDWKNVYVRKPTAEERVTGAEPLTQFGRMCATLGITIIPASSPQAKGRIERHHGTHQDRLVKKLRRAGIASLDAANAFLAATYWPEHNRRFAQPPASSDDFHLAVPRRVSLDEVFRLVETRTVSNDWVVRYANRHLQIERQTHQPPARSIVQILETARGEIELRYRGRRVRWTEIPPSAAAVAPAATRRAAPTLPTALLTRRQGQAADHPWHRAVETHRAYFAFHKDRRAWERAQPDLEPGTVVSSEDRGHF
ncbi:MAG: ISNCY family transposase [Rhodospirillaceae bacterium]